MPPLTPSPSLHLRSHSAPHKWFHPTLATLSPSPSSSEEIKYNSRKARKGRYQPRPHHLHHPSSSSPHPATARLPHPAHPSPFKPNLRLDISFWIAVIFVLGSAVWVINGFLVLLPIFVTRIEEDEEETTRYFDAAAAMAFLGGTLFEVGSYLMVVEAINRGRENDFGPSLSHLLHHSHSFSSPTPGGRDSSPSSERTISAHPTPGDPEKGALPLAAPSQRFVWWGKPLWHDLGYLAALIQLFAATIFWISTLTGLPGVIPGFPGDAKLAIVDVFFWTPQVVGGLGFVLSAALLMLEVQKKWYLPALNDIGWHIGLWNLIGAVGFLLCGAFGYSSEERWVQESGISTFWGSPAFLIGSGMQIWEVVMREPERKD